MSTPVPLKMTLRLLDQTLESGKVNRYHAVPTVKPQNDAHHQWNAFVLLWFITNGMVERSTITEVLTHDVGEYMGPGDVPYTVKRDHPELREVLDKIERDARDNETLFPFPSLTPHQTALIKLCDTLEGYIWCRLHEDRRGEIGDRWDKAFWIAMEKFDSLLTEEEKARALAIYGTYKSLNVTGNSTTK